jgi:hemerythrin-like domain-containing protein
MVSEPNLAVGLLCTHHIITRALDVTIKHSNKSSNAEELDETSRRGFIDYVQSFKTTITTHHHLETQKVFPYFRDKIPDLPVDQLNKEHGQIGILLNEIGDIIPDLYDESSLEQLNTTLTGINDIWHPHIDVEEKYFTANRMDDLLDNDETIRLLKIYGEFIMERYTPDYLVVPFQYYNLPPAEREIWAQDLPEIITNKLIPIEWKDKWSKMADFLYPDVK